MSADLLPWHCWQAAARCALAVSIVVGVAGAAGGQSVAQRGFAEASGILFPQESPNDATRMVGDLLIREEVFAKLAPWVQLAGGLDFRANSHDQVKEMWRIDFGDRGLRRPRVAVRRLTASLNWGWLTVDVGKQFIRWGKADIVNPTDRFAPRDFLNVIDNEFLAVTGARVAAAAGSDTIEAVWVPRFTPSRLPLLDQRWAPVTSGAGLSGAPGISPLQLIDAGAELPRGSQEGLRWNHVTSAFEASVSFFNGFNHLPDIGIVRPRGAPLASVAVGSGLPIGSAAPVGTAAPVEIVIARTYPAIRTYGADAAMPLRWVTIKGEAAYFTSSTSTSDEYALYVVQLERQQGEWLFVGGYVGEVAVRRRALATFAPDRGLAHSLLGRASYTVGPTRSLAFEGAVRQSGVGAYVKTEYSQTAGQHWRATMSGALIRGEPDDFLGRYRLNSHVMLAVRYSF